MAAKKEIYLIRHGETDFNLQGIVQGRGVDLSLNDTGRNQAELFFKAYHHIPFDSIHTSKLKRSKETVGEFISQGIPHYSFEELDEICWGKYEGIKSSPSMKHEYKLMMTDWANGIYETKIEGGENPLELQARQQRYIDKLHDLEEQTILICSHGRAMRSLLCTMLGKELKFMSDFSHGNLSLYKLRLQDRRFEVELFNNRDHLCF
jgi:probable phosphoglycerate mutase